MTRSHPQLFLIHGNSETEVSNARFDLICSLLTPEERDAGLTEVRGPGNQPLTLDRSLNEIIGELGMASFIPGSRRVVLIHELKELFDASRKKPAKSQAAKKSAKATARNIDRLAILVEWLRDQLPLTENIAVFVCNESDEKGRLVAQDSELYKLIRQRGEVIERKEKPLQYDFEEQVLSGNAGAALQVLKEWIERAASDSGARMKIFSTVSGIVELVLQAGSLQSAQEAGVPASQARVEDGYPTLGRAPAAKARKIEALARRLKPETLRGLVQAINELQATMYPTGEEDHVAGWTEQIETIVLRLTVLRM
jgi:hypothetical protein